MSTRRERWWGRQRSGAGTAAVDEHVESIRNWERRVRSDLSASDRFSAWVATTVGRGAIIGLHLVWFVLWIGINNGLAGVTRFDPYPYPFLTLTVSLEAIFLSLFVLASQNRMAVISDKRTHLDLQIDLLAEREMSAALTMLCAIAKRLDVPIELSEEQMAEFVRPTDLDALATKLDALDED